MLWFILEKIALALAPVLILIAVSMAFIPNVMFKHVIPAEKEAMSKYQKVTELYDK